MIFVILEIPAIGSAVLTFIGYKQTDKPNLYIDIRSWTIYMPGAEGIGSMTGYKSYLYKKINGKDKGGGG